MHQRTGHSDIDAPGGVIIPIVGQHFHGEKSALGGAFTGAWCAMFPIGFRLYGE